MKKISILIIAVFLVELIGTDILLAQQQDPLLLIEEAKEVLGRKKAEVDTLKQYGKSEDAMLGKGDWTAFSCPSCNQTFQVNVGIDTELEKGLKKIICPYDGTEFFPRQEAIREALEQPSKPITIKSPFTGREFKTTTSINDVIYGDAIVDPFTGKTFRFRPEEIKPKAGLAKGWQSVIGPDGRMFKVRVGTEDKLEEIISPYDGSVIQLGFGGIGYGGAMPFGQKKPSSIEKMFSRGIRPHVSRAIRQFGYDIFPEPTIRRVMQDAGKRDRMDAGRSYENKLFDDARTSITEMISPSINTRSAAFEKAMFYPTGNVPVGSDYILGPDDTLIINIWGAMQQTLPVTIDREGKIMLPKVGPLYLWGTKFGDAENLIREKLEESYTNINVSVTMGQLRTIRVFVLGQVKRPGAYILSSQATAFHALYEANGPTKLGTLRKIKLIREDKTEETIDLYKLLLNGDKSQDYRLSANDTIFVPSIGDVIGVAGNVKRPAIYETLSQVSLLDLLNIAGGVGSAGYLQRMQVERIERHQKRIVLDLEFKDTENLEVKAKDTKLQDGDLVIIYPVSAVRRNYVSINGNVYHSGDYQLKVGMTVKDIVDKAGGVLPDTYMTRADLVRIDKGGGRKVISIDLNEVLKADKKENILLEEWDQLRIYTNSEVIPMRVVEIEGAVNKPGRYELTNDMMVSDLIFRAGGTKETAVLENAELFRIIPEGTSTVMNIDLFKIIHRKMGSADFILQEGDHLYVREKAASTQKTIITLSGEVRYPGEYVAQRDDKLSSIIERAGGFTKKAFLHGAVFKRQSLKKIQQDMLKRHLESERNALLQEQSSLAGISSSSAQSDARMELLRFREKMLESLDNIEVPGRMIIKLDELEFFKGSEYDIFLENGDSLYIPTAPSSAQVVGNVYTPTAITFKEGAGVDYYLSKAGGVTKSADVKKIYVIRANGETVSKFARALKVGRGDTIVVPEAFKYKTPTGLIVRDTVGVLYQITLGAIAVAALD